MPSKIDISGQRFGRLVVVSEAPKLPRKKAGTRWHCRCDCGKKITTETGALRSGHTQSCGCYHKDQVADASSTHGMTRSPEWRAWRAMVARCTVPTNGSYPNYGGRGISVCDRWRTFENFIADMGPRPPGTTLDRYPNNNGNYEPGNCRWATRSQQDSNKRTTVMVTFEGKTKTYSEWARELGTHPSVIRRRWLDHQTLHPIRERRKTPCQSKSK